MPSGAQIKIRVGASLDSGALSVFEPLEKAANKAAGNIAKSLNKGAKAGSGQLVRETKKEGDALDRELERMANKIIRDEEKAQRGRAREVEKAAKERVRLEKAANREIEQDLARHAREKAKAEKAAERAARNNPSILDKAWWKAPRGQIGIGRRAAIGVSRGTSLAYGLTGSAISMGLGAAENYASALGVDTSLAGHVQSAQAASAQAVGIANAGYIPGQGGSTGQLQDSAEILKEIQSAGDKTATSFADMGGGLRRFVDLTGDLQTGRDTLLDLGKLAKATGANFVDMSEEAAEIANHMGDIPEKGPAILAVMRAVAGQGKLGAVATKDLAKQMAKIASKAGMFEGGVAKNISDLGVFAQEAKLEGGAASASQAATSVARFTSGFGTKATLKNWKAANISPYTDKTNTTLRSPMELVLEALRSTKGSIPALKQLFPSEQGIRPVAGFAAVYRRTQGSEEDKLHAVVAEFERLKSATLTQEEVTRSFNAVMDTSQSKVQLANNKLDKLAGDLEDALLPAIAGLAPAIEAMTPAFESALGSISRFILGYDAAEAAEKEKAAKQQNALATAGKELDKVDTKTPVALLKDVPNVTAEQQVAEKIETEAEKKAPAAQGKLMQDQAAANERRSHWYNRALDFLGGKDQKIFGMETIAGREQHDLASDKARLDEQTQNQKESTAVLKRIETLLAEGRVQLTTPSAPSGGREPGEADDGSHSSHE